jgi:hypothetical protein
LFVLGAGAYVLHRIGNLHNRVHRLEFESPLRQVIAVNVELKRQFFSESLQLPDDEVDFPEIVRAIRLRLQLWKGHYAGDVSFYANFDEERLDRSEFSEYPTRSSQFPIELAAYPLFGKRLDVQIGPPAVGANSPEKLVVLLSHKAIIIRARDGRFPGNVSSGHLYRPEARDLLIPIRADDLREYEDDFGHDDPDFLQMIGSSRRYQWSGRWAAWNLAAVSPEILSFTTSFLDKSPVRPND